MFWKKISSGELEIVSLAGDFIQQTAVNVLPPVSAFQKFQLANQGKAYRFLLVWFSLV